MSGRPRRSVAQVDYDERDNSKKKIRRAQREETEAYEELTKLATLMFNIDQEIEESYEYGNRLAKRRKELEDQYRLLHKQYVEVSQIPGSTKGALPPLTRFSNLDYFFNTDPASRPTKEDVDAAVILAGPNYYRRFSGPANPPAILPSRPSSLRPNSAPPRGATS